MQPYFLPVYLSNANSPFLFFFFFFFPQAPLVRHLAFLAAPFSVTCPDHAIPNDCVSLPAGQRYSAIVYTAVFMAASAKFPYSRTRRCSTGEPGDLTL